MSLAEDVGKNIKSGTKREVIYKNETTKETKRFRGDE